MFCSAQYLCLLCKVGFCDYAFFWQYMVCAILQSLFNTVALFFFYGIENGIEYANILTTRSEGYFWGHLPSSVIPIADDSWGGMVVMDMCSGVVAVMYPAREEWDEVADSPTRYILANSFEDFLDNLRPPT